MSRRRERRRHAHHVSHDRWLVSYADFITLLFAFFVVLYASSQVDKRKVGMLALAIQVAFQQMGVFPASTTEVPIDSTKPMPFSIAQAIENTERTASLGRVSSKPEGSPSTSVENGDLAQLQTELESELAPEIARKEIAMRREPDGLVISLREIGFFESGSARMMATSEAALDRIARMLGKRDYRLRIEGYTDNAPIHTAQFPSNWELSTSRATEIVRVFIVREGFSPDHLSAAGYGEYHPLASNLTAEGRSTNRRVDIVILSRDSAPASASPSASQASAPAGIPNAGPEANKATPTSSPATLKPTAGKPVGEHLQQ
ncbi:MAG: flagellar motor protein MotB [Terriglobales bacterium]